MHIAIDLQGAQTESRFRGIGRYSLSLALAIARNRGRHRVTIGLSGLFPETIESIRGAFHGLLEADSIRVWSAPGPTRETDPANRTRREVAERIREAFFADLQADVVLITSLFEGMGDDAVASVGSFDHSTPAAVVLYDLIPLISPDINFQTNSVYIDWYARKVASLRNSKLLLAISSSSRDEALVTESATPEDVVSISGACDPSFRELQLSDAQRDQMRRNHGITRPFVMYTGGADERKNLHRLIEAYASLPKAILDRHQLVFVGRMPQGHVDDCLATARKHGLTEDDLYFTGYVSDAALVELYNCCTLFVFPSLHEGLGLPPLEAMSCGAPVIGSNATSLPEIIGREDALFDPESVEAISQKLAQALSDDAFRSRLIDHGRTHARKFSWDETAKRALAALSRFDRGALAARPSLVHVEKTSLFERKSKRILLLKLDHMGDFLLALPAISKLKARYPFAILDVVVGSWSMAIAQSVKLFDNIYTLDFFKRASAAAPGSADQAIKDLVARLGSYDLTIDLRRQRDTRFILLKIKSACKVGYGTFDPALDKQLDIVVKAFPDVPFETTPLNRTHIARQMLSLVDALPNDINDYVCLPDLGQHRQTSEVVVALFPTAGNDVKQWAVDRYVALAERLLVDKRVDAVHVYFGSEAEAKPFDFKPHDRLQRRVGLDFAALMHTLGECTVCVANNSFGAHVASYAGCLVIGIYGGHESVAEWAPAFGESYVIHRAAACSPCHIPKRADCPNGMFCLDDITVDEVCDRVLEAVGTRSRGGGRQRVVTTTQRTSAQIVDQLIESVSRLDIDQLDGAQRVRIAEAIARNHRLGTDKRQLLVDVSELVMRDARSGIQRVVRAVLGQLLSTPPDGYSVEPVYARADSAGYRYARSFTRHFLQDDAAPLEDSPVEVWSGDIFLGLDLNAQVSLAQRTTLHDWRRRGVSIVSVIYDLIPVQLPAAFPDGAAQGHQSWLETISQFDGAIAISKATADEMRTWLDFFGPERQRPFKLGWFRLGADVQNTSPSSGVPEDAKRVLRTLGSRPSFLMVGTLEPRKGHAQALAAFELLWKQGTNVNLVIVGKHGWMVDELVNSLGAHRELGKHLYWLQGVSDEYLEQLYDASAALLVASEAEGFGLPLVEAAQHRLPIIARDLAVFREVASDHAYYFEDSRKPAVLADAVRSWLLLYEKRVHPASAGMPSVTWKQSVEELVEVVVKGAWGGHWMPDGVRRYWGADPRLRSNVGERRGKSILSTGAQGQLLFGPYVALPAGSYRFSLRGQVEQSSGSEILDVVYQQGRKQVLRKDFQTLPKGEWIYGQEFEITSGVDDIEVRLDVGPGALLQVDSVEIAPVVRPEAPLAQGGPTSSHSDRGRNR